MASRWLSEADPVDPGSGASPRIREMVCGDLDQVMVIERVSFGAPWAEVTFQSLLRRTNACLLAAVDPSDRILGYAAVWFAHDAGELGNLAVSPSARRSGVGTFLVLSVVQEARVRGIGQVFLEVREANRGARKLYRKHGFETVGRRQRYYANPVEDALVMRRLLFR